MGYCLALFPPEPVKATFEDLVNSAKFHLSLEKHVLMNDPVLNAYSDEEILVEWYAIVAARDEKFGQDLLTRLGTGAIDDIDFLDKLVEKGQKEREASIETLDASEEEFEFKPEDVLGSKK